LKGIEVITLIYDPFNGDAVRDADADSLVATMIDLHEHGLDSSGDYGTANVFLSIRAAIAEQKIASSDVSFVFRKPEDAQGYGRDIPVTIYQHGSYKSM
jgi:hypothetical protein